MKKLIYIMYSLCCFALYSCGMTEPWKEWENEGNMSEDRLRPSELKKILCAADGWEMTYQGKKFYFEFADDNTVISNTDKTIFENEVSSVYHLDFQGEDIITLDLDNSGALQFLTETSEQIWRISSFSDRNIEATGSTYGEEMVLTAITATQLQQAKEEKRSAILAYNKAQSVKVLKEQLSNGLLRNSSEAFIAQYAFTWNDADEWNVEFTWFQDGKVQNKTCAVSLDMTGDEYMVMAVTDSPFTIQSINYRYADKILSTSNSDVSISEDFHSSNFALRNGVDWLNTYTSNWKTNKVDRDNIHADLRGIFHADVEFDDRSPRNIIACPWNGMGSYITFQPTITADNETGRIFIKLADPFDLFGWNNNPNDYALVERDYGKFLNLCKSEKGLCLLSDNEGYTYFVSPVTGQWFRIK
ncbi:hypothetical protein AB9N12_03510 [Bacteroides sp. AN502(2024)]|uniref:hypothetical protein n=1 Tax=Bacteroides sp. AN502(2024) TaxID=3160599 RepID=UPI003515324D